MGAREDAAAALAGSPGWVAVHECTLAKLDVIVALAGAEGYDVDGLLRELDDARSERDRAVGDKDALSDLCRLDTAGRCTRADHDHSDGHSMEQPTPRGPRLRVLPGHCTCVSSPGADR